MRALFVLFLLALLFTTNSRGQVVISLLSDSPDPVAAEDEVLFSLTFSNEGTENATDISVSLALERDAQFVEFVIPNATSSCNASSGTPQTVECSITSLILQPNETVSVTFLITAPSNGSAFTTTVTVGAQVGINATNDEQLETTTISSQSSTSTASGTVDLQVTITQNPAGDVVAGKSIDTLTRVTNAGPDTATGVQCVITVPFDSTTLGAVTPVGQGNCAPSDTFEITCNLSPLDVSELITIGLVHIVPNTTAPGTIGETSASCTAAQTDSNPADNTAELETEITSGAARLQHLYLALLW